MWVRSLGLEDPLEEGIATHSSIPSWRIPWTEEPGEVQSMGSQRVRHDWGDLAHTHRPHVLALAQGSGREAELTRSRMRGPQCAGCWPSGPRAVQSSRCWRRSWGVLTHSCSSDSSGGRAPHTPPAHL